MTTAFIGGIGPMELAIVLVIALIILGPRRLPQAARGLGSAMRELRESLAGRDEDERGPSALRADDGP
jgi:sec-independent protein translocase protein TatA